MRNKLTAGVLLSGVAAYMLRERLMFLASSYPNGLDNFPTNHVDMVGETVKAQTINDLAAAVNNLEAALGVQPNQGNMPVGLFASVVARLNAIDTPGINNVTPPYTPVMTDLGIIINCGNTGAATVTIPPNSAVAFPIGATLTFRIGSTGTVTFAGGTGVTIQSRGGAVSSAGQFAMVTATQTAINFWTLAGDLV